MEEELEYTEEDVRTAIKELEEMVVEVDWSRDAELSNEQIDQLLAGKRDDVEMDAWDNSVDHTFYLEDWARGYIAKEHGVPEKELYEHYPIVDLRFDWVINNSTVYLAVPLIGEEDFGHSPTGYGGEYEDYEHELKVLGVNPHLMYNEWPDLPERDDPLIDPDQLYELWNNLAFYWSVYMILLDGTDILLEAYREGKITSNVVKKGATVTLHDYVNGASSVEACLRRDVKIDPADIFNDGGSRYGIQACCSLYAGAWDGQLVKEGE